MFGCLHLWRTPPEPHEAREAARAAAEEQARLRGLTEFLGEQRRSNHFAERLSLAFAAPPRKDDIG